MKLHVGLPPHFGPLWPAVVTGLSAKLPSRGASSQGHQQHKLQEIVKDRKAWRATVHVVKSPFRLAEQKDYPSVFFAVEAADRISTKEFSYRQDEDSLPFWNPPPEAAGKPER